MRSHLLALAASLLVALVNCQQQQPIPLQQQPPPQQPSVELMQNFPFYMQSPIPQRAVQSLAPSADGLAASQRLAASPSPIPNINQQQQPLVQNSNQNNQDDRLPAATTSNKQQKIGKLAPSIARQSTSGACLYDKHYFSGLEQCLARRPAATVGLPAFKNEDLLVARGGLGERHGCVFVLNNGLFKNYQVTKLSVDDDNQCLDRTGRVGLTMGFSNVTLYYLWTLRCLNYADQLLDDGTLGGKITRAEEFSEVNQQILSQGICVGSSQNFGFSSIQLTNLEAQVELATDIYKNWRITNVTVAMGTNNGGPLIQSAARSFGPQDQDTTNGHDSNNPGNAALLLGSGIRDFTFESLDGDELNWRYLHLYRNWSRNKLHTNFVEQFKRYLWISMERCLSESSERLPTRLMDMFGPQKFSTF